MKDVRKILTLPENEVELSERSNEVNVNLKGKEIRATIKALKDTIEANNLTALSAPCIGVKERIICIKFDTEIKTFIDPVLLKTSGLELSKETSVTEPGKKYIRPRNNDVNIIYYRPTGQIESKRFVGLSALVLQQQMDFLDGLQLCDVGLEIDDTFETASEEERQEVISEYLASLDLKQKDINTQIESDPELKQTSDAIKFMEGVATGKVKFENQENTEK